MTEFDAKLMWLSLLKTHKLYQWSIVFDNAKTRVGICNYKTKSIGLSKYFLSSLNKLQLKDVLLHEIAHVLAWHGNWHGSKWKTIAKSIWCTNIARTTKITIEKKWLYTASCPNCKKSFQAHRKRKIACGDCCKKFNNNKFDSKFEIIFKTN